MNDNNINEIELYTGRSQLMTAAMNGDFTQVKILLDAGADVNLQNTSGKNALMEASEGGGFFFREADYVETIKLLLDAGSDVNQIDTFDNTTALMKAVGRNKIEVVRMLIDAGANLNVQDISGRTAILNASSLDNGEIVFILLMAGANPNIRDNFNDALGTARWGNKKSVIKAFEEYDEYLRRRLDAVRVIQGAWDIARYNPEYEMMRRIGIRDFEEHLKDM